MGHHQIASETLVPHKIILDRDGKFATLESMTEFRGRKGQDRDNFFGWGPITEGTGPVVKMIVFYHLDDAGRITHLEPAGSSLVKRADSQANGNGDATKGRPPGFYTKDHVQTYIELFSSNQFDKTSGFWAPDLKVTLGPTVIQGREDNIKFFESQRAGNVNEKVEPTAITLDESSCALRAVVTFTALRDFPEVRTVHQDEVDISVVKLCGANIHFLHLLLGILRDGYRDRGQDGPEDPRRLCHLLRPRRAPQGEGHLCTKTRSSHDILNSFNVIYKCSVP